MTNEDQNRINHLLRVMKMADKAYWNSSSNNIISDGEYDNLYAELKQYKKKYPHDKKIVSYFSDMHENQDNTFTKRKQLYNVRSLDKTRTLPEVKHFLDKWNTNPKSLWYTKNFLIEKKNDGISSVFYFNDKRMGKPLVVLTRGSGVAGADITPEVKYYARMNINKIIKRVNGRHLVVRGELLISHQSFRKLNEQGNTKFKNCRNLASGSVFDKNPKIAGQRGIFLSAYTILDKNDWANQYPTELQQMKFLRNLGFNVIQDIHMFPNTKDGKSQILHYMFDYSHRMRLGIDHDVDGLVIKPNETLNENKLGWTAHAPRAQKSYKYPPQRALARVKKIRYQVSPYGKLTPVIIFNHPVNIFGATIKKCTGSSLGNMKKNNIMINGYITIKRMNDVIPKAFGVKGLNEQLSDLKTPKSALPDDAVKKGKFYYIPKVDIENSLPVIVNRWSNFVSKKGLNIMGLSNKVIKVMIQNKLINAHNFSSLWKINHQDFVKTPSFAEKGWNNLQSELKKVKSTPLNRVFMSLPINNSGLSMYNPIAKRIDNMHPILENKNKRQAMEQKLLKEIPAIKGLGSATIPVIKELFSDKIIKQLQDLAPYLDMKDNQQNVTQNIHSKISGMNFAITGSLNHPRKFYKNLIQKNGANLRGVTGKTNYLICNKASSSSKYRKAQVKHIPIITEQQFMKLLK